MKETAGTLLFRNINNELEVLLIHPSGKYNSTSPWGIPKGLPDPGETLKEAAIRETMEEAGVQTHAEELISLGFVDYTKSKKRIHCWMGLAPENCKPYCASWEVDGAEFFKIEAARELIHPDQEPLIDRFLKKYSNQ